MDRLALARKSACLRRAIKTDASPTAAKRHKLAALERIMKTALLEEVHALRWRAQDHLFTAHHLVAGTPLDGPYPCQCPSTFAFGDLTLTVM